MAALLLSNKDRKYRTRIAHIWFQNSILCIKVLPGAELVMEDAVKSINLVKKITRGAQFCLCIDIRNMRSINHDARSHFSNNIKDSGILAIGLIADTPLSCIIANFFLGFNKPTKPLRIFNCGQSAEAWLRGFLKITNENRVISLGQS
jgi:hypothetical protein